MTRDAVRTVQATVAEATALYEAGRLEQAQNLARGAVQSAKQLGHRPTEAEALRVLGQTHLKLDEGTDAERVLRQAWYVAEAAGHDDVKIWAVTDLAFVTAAQLERPDEAIRIGEYGQALLDRIGRGNESEARLLNALGVAEAAAGRNGKALELFESALRISQQVRGPDHRNAAPYYVNAGKALSRMGRFEGAIWHIRQSAAIKERAFGTKHPSFELAETMLGSALSRWLITEWISHSEGASQGGPSASSSSANEAEDLLRRVLRRQQDRPGSKTRPVVEAEALASLGFVLLARGKPEEALTVCEGVSVLAERSGTISGVDRVCGLTCSGMAQSALHRPEQAVDRLEAALAESAKMSKKGVVPELLEMTTFGLAKVLWQTGRDKSRALALATETRESCAKPTASCSYMLPRIDEWLAAVGSARK